MSRFSLPRRLPDLPDPPPCPTPHTRARTDAGADADVAPSPIAAVVAAHEARLDVWAATLHDDVLQPLYALRLADAHLSPDDRAARLDAIAASVHRLISSLVPPVLADFGLASALHALAPTADIRLGGTDETDLPAPTARYLFRIVQDALDAAAAVRTGSAPVVHLGVSADAATLDVTGGDDGALPLVRAASYAHAAEGTLVVRETAEGTGYRVSVPLVGAR